jgi:hypothetical protein
MFYINWFLGAMSLGWLVALDCLGWFGVLFGWLVG